MLTVVGFDGGPLPPGAAEALAGATLVAGGTRHLAAVEQALDSGAERLVLGPVAAAVSRLAAHSGPAVVVASGDPGFFGIVRALRRAGLDPRVLPAVGSVAHAFARLGLCWDDAVVVSAHGRDLRRAVNVCRAYPKVAVLTGPGAGPMDLAAALRGLPRRLVVASRLGTPEERISGPEQATDPNVTLVLAVPGSPAGPRQDARLPAGAGAGPRGHALPADGAGGLAGSEDRVRRPVGPGDGMSWLAGRPPGPAGWALPETAFTHRDSMITKVEVRALVLARLGPRTGDLIWDVGAGSGSVAVECARLGAAAIAVERDREACLRVAANAKAHSVEVEVVTGVAPEALDGLPEPDAVFVGGGGPAALDGCLRRSPHRLVAAFAAVERVGPALGALGTAGYLTGGTQLQASRLVPLPAGGGHRLAATNPVYVVWGERTA